MKPEINVAEIVKMAKNYAIKSWPSLSKPLWWLVLVVFGAVINHGVEGYLNSEKEDQELAKYYVASMPLHCQPKTSMELDERIRRFVESTKRTRADGRGIPIWREDCSIGALFALEFEEQLRAKERAAK
ncbi:MAG: hypothetical protein ABL960_15105 [Nitrospira sp.]